jgi:hypothetical protein
MLEFFYDDTIRKFHLLFRAEYQESDDFLQIERKLEKAKSNISSDKIEFYISIFLHHLVMDGSNREIEIYTKPIEGASSDSK